MKNNLKAFIFLLATTLLISCNKKEVPEHEHEWDSKKTDTVRKRNFYGYWVWDKEDENRSFIVNIEKKDSLLVGYYCAVMQQGQRTDCSYDSISFRVLLPVTDEIVTDFRDNYSFKNGKVKLKLVGDELKWEIIEEPKGIFYCPLSATLKQPK